ncbi:LysR family transcriptional regulator [Campylobacter canadensis]|uniref:TOBE domain-containing protein n=1 Tax=Campylobacter canadensis TaxID=449520 RepID=UPI0015570B6F|nr:TOBE domain-containing protein [Campylobacter canadensis]MBZ7995398.1 LysR family transcriptional regulator [Campylobacter canadensis]MBZ7997057.1 LysR family transcriptional regulator [Campylobacter canadensis]MBZ8000574.1 LysR family transcriptional regulator [Campylobacter canadensis]MBZ8002340.1 LysR family transcriptional regulator [Campylobacter canadensis]MBZ8003471.1 LysR family transcriptional regulator [Campylobacter canadensis]
MKINLELEFILNNDVKINAKHIKLLKQILLDKSILKAAKNLNISYKNAWDSLNLINQNSIMPLFNNQSKKEGAKLSLFALKLIEKYDEFTEYKSKLNDDFRPLLSARNVIKAKIININLSKLCAKVTCELNGVKINVLISNSAVYDLQLKVNDYVFLIFKINFIELEEEGENSFKAKIVDMKIIDGYYHLDLAFADNILQASVKVEKLKRKYKIGDEILSKIKADKIILSL